MVIGCIVFTLPHFLSVDRSTHSYLSSSSYNTERLVQFNDSDVMYPESANETLNANGKSNESDSSGIMSLGQVDHKPITKGSRNAICRSANPHSSRFISGESFRSPVIEPSDFTIGRFISARVLLCILLLENSFILLLHSTLCNLHNLFILLQLK